MERILLVLVLVLVLVAFCQAESWNYYCHSLPCPSYRVTDQAKNLREYYESKWITTPMYPSQFGFMAARSRLKSITGYKDSWPVVINVTNHNDYRLSWYVENGTNPNVPNNGPVQLETGKNFSVYVRDTGRFTDIQQAHTEVQNFCTSLAVSCANYSVVVFDILPSLIFHSEIWIYKSPTGT